MKRLAAIAALCALCGGCASYQAARLYAEGSRALEGGDTEGAVAHLERAAELAPHASEVHNHLGLAYLASGRPDDARGAFERAVALDCDNHAAQANLRVVGAERAGSGP